MGKFIVILFFLCVSFFPAECQTKNDTIPAKETKVHSPKKASIYSAILPGLGQAYNKKYWKIPIIYGGFGALVYFIDWNNDWYHLFKNAYFDLSDYENFNKEAFIAKYDKLPELAHFDYESSTNRQNILQSLSRAQDGYRRNRDLLIISTAVFYAMNIIDASVDAHLFNFDISDDLSMNWKPAVSTIENQKYLCINCKISF
ncbi:MAG: hypothetical protein JXR31_14480 [Prolixibacteraceae bacterium]|nr:hypothetical protein [Prolixibacteraceae bacterium]MBN2775458.1 hypothetical protein [Prolixibacteraceae bacterium]